jgi:SAM-dependent methyltransferase
MTHLYIRELEWKKLMAIPTQAEIEDKLRGEDLNTWLDLWRAEQGPAKPGALKLMAAVIPFPIDRSLRVLDVGCGTGDAGRAIHSRFPRARIDSVDRNEFFVSLCGAVNRRDGIGGRRWVCDLSEPIWRHDLASDHDVVVAVNTMHWFSLAKAAELFGDIFQLLRPGGVFLLMEPAAAEPPFAPGFDMWKEQQPAQHRYEDWRRFWSRVNALVGYDYGFLGDPPQNQNRIGDGLSAMQWVDLLRDAGFQSCDILLRDAEKVALASVKP